MQKFVGREMDAPEFVAKRSLEGLLNKELHVVFGGDERERQIQLNFEHPEKFDLIAEENYDDRKQSSQNHRAL